MRCDGKRVKGLSTNVAAIPFVMSKRVDAQNAITEYTELEPIKEYIQQKRREGIRMSHMSLVLAAYHRAAMEHPEINRFVMNSRVYQRNHFCVSFVILKQRPDGKADETPLKVYFKEDDDILSINEKVENAIALNSKAEYNNNADKFTSFMLSLPILPYVVINLAKWLDRVGLLPRFIVDLSPFHTSMFITNLASINTTHIYHHCYEFGTTGVFICMGKPVADHVSGDYDKKLLPLGIVMDERICTGYQYACFWKTLRKYLRHPEMLEAGYQKKEKAEEATV